MPRVRPGMADTKARPKKSTAATSDDRGDARPDVTTEEIAARAYEISQSDVGGTSEENWLRAEQELRNRSTEVAP
jgi:hypothetical protein